MRISAFLWHLARDEAGGPLVEVTIMIPILITFLLGAVDIMNALRQWNAAAKAVELGARIAAVSDPVAPYVSFNTNNLDNGWPASGANSNIALDALSSLNQGATMNAFQITCDGGSASCTCTSGTCGNFGLYNAAAMGLIVYGRDGNGACGDAAGEYFMGMCDLFSAIQPRYVRVIYTQTGLSFAGRRCGAVPTITVALNQGTAKLKFQFFFLPFASINIPSMQTTITGEALNSTAVDLTATTGRCTS